MSDTKPTAEENARREALGLEVQPDPIPTGNPSSHDRVIELFEKRKAFGLEKYETLLQAGNGRDHIGDVLDELADAMVYLQTQRDELALARWEAWNDGYVAHLDHIHRTLSEKLSRGVWVAVREVIAESGKYAPENPFPHPFAPEPPAKTLEEFRKYVDDLGGSEIFDKLYRAFTNRP